MTTSTGSRRVPAARGQGDALRQEILDAAAELVAEHGDARAVTLRAVARKVGVATTSIYLHFKGVDELMFELKRCRFEELGQAWREASDPIADPRERLRATAHAYVRYGQEHPEQYRLMFSTGLRRPTMNDDEGPVGMPAFRRLVEQTATYLAVEVADPSATTLALHLWTSMHGVVHLRTTMTAFDWPDLEQQIDDLLDRLLPD